MNFLLDPWDAIFSRGRTGELFREGNLQDPEFLGFWSGSKLENDHDDSPEGKEPYMDTLPKFNMEPKSDGF